MNLLNGAIVAAAVGLALLLFGLRGRRVGDHPHCWRCGFDLFGKPAESEVRRRPDYPAFGHCKREVS